MATLQPHAPAAPQSPALARTGTIGTFSFEAGQNYLLREAELRDELTHMLGKLNFRSSSAVLEGVVQRMSGVVREQMIIIQQLIGDVGYCRAHIHDLESELQLAHQRLLQTEASMRDVRQVSSFHFNDGRSLPEAVRGIEENVERLGAEMARLHDSLAERIATKADLSTQERVFRLEQQLDSFKAFVQNQLSRTSDDDAVFRDNRALLARAAETRRNEGTLPDALERPASVSSASASVSQVMVPLDDSMLPTAAELDIQYEPPTLVPETQITADGGPVVAEMASLNALLAVVQRTRGLATLEDIQQAEKRIAAQLAKLQFLISLKQNAQEFHEVVAHKVDRPALEQLRQSLSRELHEVRSKISEEVLLSVSRNTAMMDHHLGDAAPAAAHRSRATIPEKETLERIAREGDWGLAGKEPAATHGVQGWSAPKGTFASPVRKAESTRGYILRKTHPTRSVNFALAKNGDDSGASAKDDKGPELSFVQSPA